MTTATIELGLLDDEQIALDDAALSLAALDHPEVDVAPCRAVISAMAQRLQDSETAHTTARQQASLLASVIADDFGFDGDRDTYDDPDNADMIRAIDRRKGLPVTLSILYVALARRVGWDAQPLDVPGHVLVMVGGGTSPVIVDPFRGGVTVSPDEIVALIAAHGSDERPAVRQIATMTNRQTLVRLLMNQASRAEATGTGRRALTLYERMTTFAPDHADAWWQRARLELTDGRVPDARTSLAAMLEITRDATARKRINDALGALTPS
jgi:regulator of sirC expression with transglutaminase-like and TPR domain